MGAFEENVPKKSSNTVTKKPIFNKNDVNNNTQENQNSANKNVDSSACCCIL
jgi:hypothetical protein